MKKILFYCDVFYPQLSGYSNAFQNLINAVLDFNEDVHITVATPYPLEGNLEIARGRLKVIRLKNEFVPKKLKYFLGDYLNAKKVSRLFLEEKFDFLFVETFERAVFLSSLDKEVYSKTVVRVHSTSETEYAIWPTTFIHKVMRFCILNFAIKKVKWIASTNSFHIDFVKKYYLKEDIMKISRKNFFVIPNTIKNFNEIDVNKSSTKIKIFTLGRMDELGFLQKGFFDLFVALKTLPKEILNKFEITVVGAGKFQKEIVKFCEGMSEISFLEKTTHNETLDYLKSSDVVVLPSRFEGLSMFALEGLATGNLCLFSKTGGLIDLIDDNGFHFEPQSIETLADTLKSVSSLTDGQIVERKKSSLELFEKKFSDRVVAEKFMKVFEIVKSSNNLLID